MPLDQGCTVNTRTWAPPPLRTVSQSVSRSVGQSDSQSVSQSYVCAHTNLEHPSLEPRDLAHVDLEVADQVLAKQDSRDDAQLFGLALRAPRGRVSLDAVGGRKGTQDGEHRAAQA